MKTRIHLLSLWKHKIVDLMMMYKYMVMVSIFGQMVQHIQEIGLTVFVKEMENTAGQRVVFTRGLGKMICGWVWDNILIAMVSNLKEFGTLISSCLGRLRFKARFITKKRLKLSKF